MEIKELIKYIYERDIENIEFEDDSQKGDRALILLSKYGEDSSGELKKIFEDKVNFNNITPLSVMKINEMIRDSLKTTYKNI